MKTQIKLYNDTVTIQFNEEAHQYWLETEEMTKAGTPKLKRLTGATTFISIKDNANLRQWYADMAIKSIEKNLGYLSQPNVDPSEILEEARMAATNYKDETANLGKEIHAWIEAYINAEMGNGEQPKMPSDNNVLLGVTSFLDWVDYHQVKFIWSERIVYSKKYQYVGTADLCVEIEGEKYLVDLKTGNGLYSTVGLQTAAYIMADIEESGEKYAGRIAIRLTKETKEDYEKRLREKKFWQGKELPPYRAFEAIFLDDAENNIEKDYAGFLACKDLYDWNRWAEDNFKNIK